MFSPPKLKTILAGLLTLTILTAVNDVFAQQSAEFEKRAAAMRRARARAQTAEHEAEQVSYVQTDSVEAADEFTEPPAAARVAQSMPNAVAQRRPIRRTLAAGRARMMNSRGPVRAMRASQMVQDGIIIDGGAPIMGGTVIGESYPTPVIGNGYEQGVVMDGGYDQGISVDGGHYMGGEVIDGGMISAGCNSCGDTGGYFESDSCCGRGGCPDGGPCWLGNLGKALRNGEYFGGAVAFQSPLFTQPGQDLPADENQLASDSSFGFYGGFNLGIPLCRLSCGLLSGQFGIRSVNTNFNGNEFTNEDRRQIFVTTGLYRRVDYGLQFGVVADILHEEWFTETDLVQIRADIGWVYPAGHVFGFRYATGVQDELTDGVFDAREFDDFFQTTDDNFRLYYRHAASSGGWGEAFVGWAETNQTVIGLDVDLPVTERLAFQSGFTAYLNDDIVSDNSNFRGGNLNEAWNLYVGVSFRPSGRSWYRSYDRPMFNVADSGSMIVRRQSPELTP